MGSERRLSGREERRLPIMMQVDVAPLGCPRGERCEKTYTDNISPHGIRMHSTGPWQLGEQAEITPTNGEISMRGEVVYCQKAGKDRYFVGFKFAGDRMAWSILQRFNGLALTGILCAMRW
jgi:hypothetical protein